MTRERTHSDTKLFISFRAIFHLNQKLTFDNKRFNSTWKLYFKIDENDL